MYSRVLLKEIRSKYRAEVTPVSAMKIQELLYALLDYMSKTHDSVQIAKLFFAYDENEGLAKNICSIDQTASAASWDVPTFDVPYE